MEFFLGFDGGGSRTRAAVCSADGLIQVVAEAPGSNPHHAGWEGCGQSLRKAFEGAWGALKGGHAGPVRLAGAFFGLAGVSSATERARVVSLVSVWQELQGAAIGVDHDIRVAWAGAFGGRPGIALIAGTGSSAYARNARGVAERCGGWGSILDDVGSGYALAIDAIRAVTHAHDGRGRATTLRDVVLEFFQVKDVHEIPGVLHAPAMTRDRIAGLAPSVFARAVEGDGVAKFILEGGARELSRLAAALQKRVFSGEEADVALTGGLSGQRVYLELLREALAQEAPGTRLHQARHSSLAGAVLQAAAEARHSLPAHLTFHF